MKDRLLALAQLLAAGRLCGVIRSPMSALPSIRSGHSFDRTVTASWPASERWSAPVHPVQQQMGLVPA
ncbi:hypothetical protein [Nocardia abscessus]|uniref:hypothetical protein n=1 Tax=Nocardia abscessus TaxID=120957 RepID=UPI00245910A7|nr:hypothetical protein [Nocardia abscessus]